MKRKAPQKKRSFPELESDRIKREADFEKVYDKLLNLVSYSERKQIIDEISKKLEKENIRFSKTMDGLKKIIQKCKGQTELIELQANADKRSYPAKTLPSFSAR